MMILISNISSLLSGLNIFSISLRLILALAFSGFIGYERGKKRHPAGFRTHILVCVGSALTIMVGIFIFNEYGGDPSRIGAQVISGIGFLGVGTIIFSGGKVKGVTTAAGLWATAAMGLALGSGFYTGAILGFFAIYGTMIVLQKTNKIKYKDSPKEIMLSVTTTSLKNVEKISKLLEDENVNIKNILVENFYNDQEDEHLGETIIFHLDSLSREYSSELLLNVREYPDVISAYYIGTISDE